MGLNQVIIEEMPTEMALLTDSTVAIAAFFKIIISAISMFAQ